MGVTVLSDGVPVTLDGRLWSWDENLNPVAANSYIGSADVDPIEIYRSQRAVRTVVGFLARNIAQVSMHSFRDRPNGDRERVRDSILAQTLKQPDETATAYEAMNTLVTDVCLFDRWAAMPVMGPDGRPQVQRLPPDLWQFVRDRLGRPTGIVTRFRDSSEEVPLSRLAWIDGYPDPRADRSPLAALNDLLTEERESGRYRRDLWKGGARLGGWIERPADAPLWSDRAKTTFRSDWEKFGSGGGRAGTEPVLEDGMKYHELNHGLTPESAQQLESRKFSTAEVAAFFYLPPVFAGLLDNANYSNVTAYREILYSDTLGPWFQQIQQAFNARLVPKLDVTDEFAEFNVGEKLRMSFDKQAEIFQKTTGAPIMSRNEARQRLNLPALPGADDLIVPLNVTTGDAPDSGETDT